jgi:hypothetical protein
MTILAIIGAITVGYLIWRNALAILVVIGLITVGYFAMHLFLSFAQGLNYGTSA